MTGLGTDEPDSHWIKMTNRKTGKTDGEVLISIEVVETQDALERPVGKGRKEPNANPYLPKPVGRLKFNLNPFTMLSQLLGPRLCRRLTCVFVIIGIVMGGVFLFPSIGTVIQLLDVIPFPYGWIALGCLLLVLAMLLYMCRRNCRAMRRGRKNRKRGGGPLCCC